MNIRKAIREAIGRWIISIDVSDIFKESEDQDMEDENLFAQKRDKIVARLRMAEKEIERKIPDDSSRFSSLVDDLELVDDVDSFDYSWDELYDWADSNKVWIKTMI